MMKIGENKKFTFLKVLLSEKFQSFFTIWVQALEINVSCNPLLSLTFELISAIALASAQFPLFHEKMGSSSSKVDPTEDQDPAQVGNERDLNEIREEESSIPGPPR
jgi:hypothetical protein